MKSSRSAAVAKIGRFEFGGFLAWVAWLFVHLVQIIGFRNRLVVLVNWAWDYIFYDRAVRLISSNEQMREFERLAEHPHGAAQAALPRLVAAETEPDVRHRPDAQCRSPRSMRWAQRVHFSTTRSSSLK